MDTEGLFSPASVAEAREWYETAGASAQEVVKETARAMAFDAEEYDERVTGAVIETARDALFASLLEVHVGTREEYDTWRRDTEYAVEEIGSEHVDNVVWHAPGFGDEAVAATYQDERQAAVSTLRRQAFGRIYREVV
jgi:hypothetical protein